MNNQLEATAYHEVGHAFLAYVLGKGFQSVSIIPNPQMDYLGAITHLRDRSIVYQILEGTSQLILDKETIDCLLKSDIIVAYGGYIAELQFHEENEEGASSDFEFIKDLVYHHKEGKDATYLMNYCIKKAKMIIKDNWPLIESLAEELLRTKEMTFQEFDNCIKENMTRLNTPFSMRK